MGCWRSAAVDGDRAAATPHRGHAREEILRATAGGSVTVRPGNGQGRRDGVIVGRDAGPTMAHGQWTEIEARGVLEAWKKSRQNTRGVRAERAQNSLAKMDLTPALRAGGKNPHRRRPQRPVRLRLGRLHLRTEPRRRRLRRHAPLVESQWPRIRTADRPALIAMGARAAVPHDHEATAQRPARRSARARGGAQSTIRSADRRREPPRGLAVSAALPARC